MRSLNRCKLKNAMKCVPAQKIKMKKKRKKTNSDRERGQEHVSMMNGEERIE